MTEDRKIPEASDGPDTPLVERVRAGDSDAFGRLYDRWFDRVHDLAYRVLWDTEAAADVAQDAFLSAYRNIHSLEDPRAFGGWLLRIARNGALNRKRKDERVRPADEARLAMIEQAQTRPEDRIGALDDPQQVAEDGELAALLWSAADALGERDREVLDLHLRHGLAPNEIADVVGLNRNAANQLVHRVRQRLATAVGARVLWRGGVPACAALRVALEAADVDEFDAEAVRVAEKHAGGCTECDARRSTHLSPAQMFSAVPFLSVPMFKAKVAHALSAEGVPMQGSSALGGTRPPRRGRLRVRRSILVGGAGAIVVTAVLAFSASRVGDGQLVELVSNSTTTTSPTTSTSSTTSTSTTTTTVASTTTTTTRPTVIVPPVTTPTVLPTASTTTTTTTTAPAPTTTTVPAPPTLTLSMSPATVPPSYVLISPAAPRLTWSVQGASAAKLTGPNVNRTDLANTVVVCPVPAAGPTVCSAPRGTYTYMLEALDAGGKPLGPPKTVTLTIQ